MAAEEQEGFVFGGSPWKDVEGPSLYSSLNVPSYASGEDVRSAYRRMCITFHPDKHNNAPDKEQARVLFENIKQAYDVLSNPEKRFVYDTHGWRGLRAEKSVGQSGSTPCCTALEVEELRSRFNRQLCEERNRIQCSPSCNVAMAVNAKPLLLQSSDKRKGSPPYFTIQKLAMSQAFKFGLTARDTLRCQVALQTTKTGKTFGSVVGTYRHVFKSGSCVQGSVGLGSMHHAELEYHMLLPGDFHFSVHGTLRHVYGDFNRMAFSIIPTASATIGRRIGPCSVQMRYSSEDPLTDKPECLTTTISCNSTAASFELRSGGPPVLKLLHPIQLAPSAVLEPKASLSAESVRLSYALRYGLNDHTDISLGVYVKLPGAVGCFLAVSYQNQDFEVPIELADSLSPTALFYAHFLPLVTAGIMRYCVVKPLTYLVSREQRAEDRQRQQTATSVKRNEAAMFVRLMGATYDNSVASEQARGGLIVQDAWYGVLVSHRLPGSSTVRDADIEVADVQVATQCLVKDSKLIINSESKSSLPGFYDPAPGLRKSLRVRYEFRSRVHEVTVADNEPLQAPRQSHLVR
ncbi:dnaJ homolog subfamily C member 11-like [Sycon ciliatum]|uniref:dnaJ homolog subfamily C member 11-like n=1 Tax=Sycon ciliatum TaxID=27933 RepID=UPI0031F6903B